MLAIAPPVSATTAAVLMLVVAACGAGGEGIGALGDSETRVSKCTPAVGVARLVFADEVVENELDRTLRLEGVRLVNPDGLTLVDAFIVPITNNTLLGTVPFPPSSPVWQDRRKAVDARLGPGETWNLALTLNRDKATATFKDVEIAYTVGDSRSVHRLGFTLSVVDRPDCGNPTG